MPPGPPVKGGGGKDPQKVRPAQGGRRRLLRGEDASADHLSDQASRRLHSYSARPHVWRP